MSQSRIKVFSRPGSRTMVELPFTELRPSLMTGQPLNEIVRILDAASPHARDVVLGNVQ